MLKRSQLKKPLTVIVVLTGLAFLLQAGALGYQVFSGLIGINKTQLIYTVCNASINTILSNSNIFYLVALACAAAALLSLATMFIFILVGICKWSSPQSKYAPSNTDPNNNHAQNGLIMGNTQAGHANNDPDDEYFTSCKFMVGTVVYLVGLVGTLGHFALMLTIFVCFVVCGGVAFISLLVMFVLSGIGFVLVLVCFIKWQMQRGKLNKTNEQDRNQQPHPNQIASCTNENPPNQHTRQNLINQTNPNVEVIQPLRTQQDEIKTRANKQSKNLLAPNSSKNAENAQYISFNAKATENQNQPQISRNPYNPKSKTTTNPTSLKDSTGTIKQPIKNKQTYSEAPNSKDLYPQSQSKIQTNNQNKKPPTDSKNNNPIVENSKVHKNLDRMSLEASSKDEKHPTPKFILSEEGDNQAQEEHISSKEGFNILRQQPNYQKQNQKAKEKEKQNKARTQKYEGERNDNSQIGEFGQKKQEEQNLKQSRKEIMRNNGGKPFFKSPQKPRQSIPSYYRSPLEKYEKQDEDNIKGKFNNNQTVKNLPQTNPQQSGLKSSTSQQKLLEEQRKYLEQSNASSGRGREQPFMQKEGQRSSPQKNMEAETKYEARKQQDQKSMKKAKKTGMLIDYIRSRYAD